MKLSRENPWLYERDGDLNPTWPLVVLYCLVGLVVCLAAVFTRDKWAIIGALSFLGSVTCALLISALPRDKAKILAQSRLPGEVAKGIGSVGPRGEYGVSTSWFDDEADQSDPL
jgi:hypothetical protein